jgi:hypothetical protein
MRDLLCGLGFCEVFNVLIPVYAFSEKLGRF